VIRSDPSGAQVSIDGRRYGVTPITLADVKPGEHRIILEREGAEVRQTVRVDAGATLTVVAPLGPSGPVSGWIAVASPVELDVFEEGALLGTSRSSQIMLAAGPHTLQLVNTRLGFRREQQVRVDPGKSVQIPVELPRVLVNVNATPWAEVWIDGKHVGQTPLARVPVVIGTHEVVFRHPELGEKTVTALIRADVPNRLTADLRQQSR
jgi:hypothetical protein